MKEYKVWVRVCIEEYDSTTKTYHDVYKDEDTGIIEKNYLSSPDEICVFKSNSYDEAQAYINSNYRGLLWIS